MAGRSSLTFRLTAFIAVVCALLVISDVWRAVFARRVQLAEMTVATSNLARGMAQHADSTIKEADTTLVGVVERVQSDGTSPHALDRLHRLFVQSVSELPQLDGLYLYDRDGRWIANSQPTLSTTYNNADREYFAYHRTHRDPGPHIGTPVKSRSTGKWILPVSRRIDGPHGEFEGVALATIDIQYFSRFYRSLDIGDAGAIALVTSAGTMVVRRPYEERFVAKSMTDTTLFTEHKSGGASGSFMVRSSQDGVTRLNTYANLEHYPLFVVAALARDEILADWWSNTVWQAFGTALLVAMLSLFGWRLVRHANARTRIERRLAASLGTMRAILDTAENPIITTDRFGAVLTLNPAGEKAFGYTEAEITGQNVQQLLPAADFYALPSTEPDTTAVRAGGVARELTGQRRDGSTFAAHVSAGEMTTTGERRFVCVMTDMTVPLRERAALSEARDQLLLAADIAELGIWSWYPSEDKLQWNDRMFEMFGYEASRDTPPRYEEWRARVHPDDLPTILAQLEDAFADDTVVRHAHLPLYRIVLPGGGIRFIQTSLNVQRDAAGNAVGMTGVSIDVTEQHYLNSRLREAKRQADAASAAKSQFLANMSHEIRTPLNAVLGMLDLVQSTRLNERQSGYVANAETAAKSLLGLLNDILDYSKIEAGKLQLDVHPFEIEPFMQSLGIVLAGNQSSRNERAVEVLFDVAPDLPPTMIGDSLRLQQVLVNLAGNALKFTLQGQVVVSVTQLERGTDRVRVRVAVIDSGIGIEAAHLQQIFDGFSQAEASTTRRFGGTGLGLAISRRLVDLMGGQLKVTSEPGVGSRFWFDVTLGIAPSIALPTLPAVPAEDTPLRVLLADDNPVAREVLARTVRSLGWFVDSVSGGVDAVAQVRAAAQQGIAYDIVMLDWRMPDLDGVSAARAIRAVHASRSPALLMISAYGQEALAGAQIGDSLFPFDACVTKPVTPRQLAQAVARMRAGARGPDADSMRASHDAHAPRRASSDRLSGLTLLVVEDNALNRAVAQGLLEREGARVVMAQSGLDGVTAVLGGVQRYDVVLMDMQMPGLDGLEATRQIRADARFATLPIVAMTANASAADRDACLAAGMNDHIGKPIDARHLVDVLLRQMAGRAPVAVRPTVEALAGRSGGRLLEARDSIVSRFGGNADLIGRALGVFGTDMARRVLDLKAAVGARSAARVGGGLHAIRGSAGTMGAAALSALAGDLETRITQTPEAIPTPDEIVDLEALLEASTRQLEAMFSDPRHAAGATDGGASHRGIGNDADLAPAHAQPPYAPDEYRTHLAQLLTQLEAFNLDALDYAGTLATRIPADHAAPFRTLVDQIEALDFVHAAASTRALLELIEC